MCFMVYNKFLMAQSYENWDISYLYVSNFKNDNYEIGSRAKSALIYLVRQ